MFRNYIIDVATSTDMAINDQQNYKRVRNFSTKMSEVKEDARVEELPDDESKKNVEINVQILINALNIARERGAYNLAEAAAINRIFKELKKNPEGEDAEKLVKTMIELINASCLRGKLSFEEAELIDNSLTGKK